MSEACSEMIDRISSVVRAVEGTLEAIVMREVSGERLWCRIWDSAANWSG